MATVKLQHIDDETLDPNDSTLRTRGAVRIDGHERGVYEEHFDGAWTATIDGERLQETSKEALEHEIARRFA